MGWTTTHREKGISNFKWFSDRWNQEGFTVLKASTVNMRECYMACEVIKPTGERYVFAAVVLIHFTKGYQNFGYKDMDESCMPYYFNCPALILGMLTKTNDKNSNEWRSACWQKIVGA